MDKVELISTESFYLDLNINGKSYFRTSQYALREKLYGRALDRLDREIEKVANLNRNEELGGFLWCYTFDLHRVDGVAGTVLYYYLFEILLELKKERGDFRLIVRKSLPRFVIEVINHQLKIKTQDKVNVVDKLKLFLRYRFGPLKRFLRNKKMVTETESNPSKIEEGATIILYNIKSDLTRLKSFPDYLTEKRSKVYIVDHSLKYFKKHKASSVFRFENSNSGNVFKWLKKAYAVKSLIKSTHHKLQDEVYFTSVLKQQSFLQTFYMFWKQDAYNRLFEECKPNNVVVSTTIGDPMNRLALSSAKKHGAKTTVFSCRNFITSKRSEDRIIEPDRLAYHNTTIGDEFYVLDKMSKDHLIKSGFTGEILTYKLAANRNIQKNSTYENGLLLLFAGKYLNRGLMELAAALGKKGIQIPTLYYREHPNVKITPAQYNLLSKITSKIVCLTGIQWSELNFQNVMAVTCNTTASIDAVDRGCSLLWLPFISEQSLQFSEVMNLVGKKANSYDDAVSFIQNF